MATYHRITSSEPPLQPGLCSVTGAKFYVTVLPVARLPDELCFKWSAWRGRVTVAGLFLLAPLYLSIGIRDGISPLDEGIICHGAERVLAGEVPYRDFWTAYSPGQFYVLAALYRVFGANLLVGRIYTVAAEWAIAVALYLIVRRLAGHRPAMLACMACAVWLGYAASPLYPAIPALALALTGYVCLSRHESPRYVLAGFLTGGAILLRHDLGIYALLAQTITIFALARSANPAREWSWLACWGKYAAAVALVVLPVIALLFYAVPRDILYFALVV